MKVFVPPIARPLNVRETELRPDDTREQYRQKIARITLDSMVQFVGLLDAQGTVLEINRVALDAVGIKLSDVEGKPFWTTFWWQVSDEINQTLRESILRAAQGEFVRWDTEIYGRAGGKETIIIDASLCPVKDEHGNVVFIVAEGRDITEKKAQEREIARQREELAKLDVLKTQFFANISHEFRTPLTLMLGPLEDTMALGHKVPAQAIESLRVAHRNSLRLLRLVNSLLDFSRIEAGRAQASYEPTDLAALTAELASTFRSAMEKAGLHFVVECPPLSEPIYVDREMWEKVVLNFLSNAFKYTFQGTVTVRVEEVDGHAVLSVSDTGSGIPEHEVAHIFERFHRVEGAHGRTLEGSGIGLALVAELVKLHGGKVGVNSRLKEGSTFTVSIPFGKAHLPPDRIGAAPTQASTAIRAESYIAEALRWLPSEDGRAASSAEASHDLASASPVEDRASAGRVLVADDNADMLGYVCGLLGPHYEISAVANGAEALRVATEHPPDLVLADVMMPELDGFGLLRALRANPQTCTIPVILLSARAGEEARSEGMDAGADDYLIKPFSARELLARVGAHLRLSRARRVTEAALRTSEERLRIALDAGGGIGTWDWDVQNDRVYANARLAQLYSVDPERAASAESASAFFEAVHPEDRAYLNEKIETAMRTGQDCVAEHRVIQKNGSSRWVNARGRCQLNENGVATRFLGVAFEITDRKLAEEALAAQAAELKRSNEDLEQFAQVASHDLRSPLNTVLNFTQLIMRRHGASLNPEITELLRIVGESAKRMADLISALLNYSRLNDAESKVVESVSAQKVYEDALANLRVAIEESKAVIERGELPEVVTNPTQLLQVFQNLISNAIHYRGDERPYIRVTAERRDEFWMFSVNDNGPGIQPQYHSVIFEPFKRLHGMERPGSGIGLAFCRKFVEREGGRIWVESDEGKGANFRFTLPAAESTTATSA